MDKYLISFPGAAMKVPDREWEAAGRDAQAAIQEAKAAGVCVFGGGIDETVPPVRVSADGAVAEGGYPWAPPLNGDSRCWSCLRAKRRWLGPHILRKRADATGGFACSGSTRIRESMFETV